MLKEYYLEYKIYMLTKEYGLIGFGLKEGNLWLGEDEFDTFNYFAYSVVNKYDELEKKETRFRWAYLRPTGRQTMNRRSKLDPFIPVDKSIRPYIKGQITRYASRFLVCDTEGELNDHYNMYESFREDYKNEIPKDIIDTLELWYQNKLISIRTAAEKRVSYDTENIEDIVNLLRRSGYRISSRNGIYEIIEPKYYYDDWYLRDGHILYRLDVSQLSMFYKNRKERLDPRIIDRAYQNK